MNKRLLHQLTTPGKKKSGWLVGWVRGCKSGTKGMIQLNNKYSTAYAIFILFFSPHRVPSLSLSRVKRQRHHDYEFHEKYII